MASGAFTTGPIYIGQTTGISGAASHNGINTRAGLAAAVEEANANGGVRGRMVNVTVLDDGYSAARAAANAATLLANPNIVALASGLGTETTLAIADVAAAAGPAPVIGAQTGAAALRSPFRRHVVNNRASYDDETAAHVNLLVGVRRLSRIACFYQDDAFGRPSFAAFRTMLRSLGREPVAAGTYDTATLDVTAGVAAIAAAGRVEAVAIYALAAPAAAFIEQALTNPAHRDAFAETIFVCMSVSAGPLPAALAGLGAQAAGRVFATQVAPDPLDTTSPLVRRFQAALRLVEPTAPEYDPTALEMYINGRLLLAALAAVEGPSVTRATLTDAFYASQYFRLDDLSVGLFADGCGAARSGGLARGALCNCSQGMRQVWTAVVNTTTRSFEYVNEARYDTPIAKCLAATDHLRPSIGFGLLAPAGEEGTARAAGLRAAFAGSASRGAAGGVQLQLVEATRLSAGVPAWLTANRLSALVGSTARRGVIPGDVAAFDAWPEQALEGFGGRLAARLHVGVSATAEDELVSLVAAAAADGHGDSVVVVACGGTSADGAAAREAARREVETATNFGASLAAFHHAWGSTAVAALGLRVPAGAALVLVCHGRDDVVAALRATTASPGAALYVTLRGYAAARDELTAAVANGSAASVSFAADGAAVAPEGAAAETPYELGLAADLAAAGLPAALRSDPIVRSGYALGRVLELLVQQRANATASGADLAAQAYTASVLSVGPVQAGPYTDTPLSALSRGDDVASLCVSAEAAGVAAGRCVCPHGSRAVFVHRVTPTNANDTRAPFENVKTGCFQRFSDAASSDSSSVTVAALAGGLAAVVVALVVAVGAGVFLSRRGAGRDLSRAPQDASKPFTIAFTDIQGSTALWARVPALMGPAIDLHHEVVRGAISRNKGYEVKTIGDSFMVAFQRPKDAVAFATDVQLSLHAAKWGTRDIDAAYTALLHDETDRGPASAWRGLRVRVAFATGLGDIKYDEVTQAYDYYGTVVNTASRIEGLAHGGQICAPHSTLEAAGIDVAGGSARGDGKSSGPQVIASDLGPQVLRGIDEPVMIAQLLPRKLKERKFPPPRVGAYGVITDANSGAYSPGLDPQTTLLQPLPTTSHSNNVSPGASVTSHGKPPLPGDGHRTQPHALAPDATSASSHTKHSPIGSRHNSVVSSGSGLAYAAGGTARDIVNSLVAKMPPSGRLSQPERTRLVADASDALSVALSPLAPAARTAAIEQLLRAWRVPPVNAAAMLRRGSTSAALAPPKGKPSRRAAELEEFVLVAHVASRVATSIEHGGGNAALREVADEARANSSQSGDPSAASQHGGGTAGGVSRAPTRNGSSAGLDSSDADAAPGVGGSPNFTGGRALPQQQQQQQHATSAPPLPHVYPEP